MLFNMALKNGNLISIDEVTPKSCRELRIKAK